MRDIIRTKLLFEHSPGKIISLGFGDITNSDADLIIISAFSEPSFVPTSSIGFLSKSLEEQTGIKLEEYFDNSFEVNGYQLIDVSTAELSYKKILTVCMGSRNSFKNHQHNPVLLSNIVTNNLKVNLQKCINFLVEEKECQTLDITALGTKYGGLHRKESFDLLINWANELLTKTTNINLIRFVAFDLDTFVDFFESIYRFKNFKPVHELSFHADYDIEKYPGFKDEIHSALNNLDQNPRNVIVTCRSIIENIVKTRLNNSQIKLADGINLMKEQIPPNIFSYLTTCRILGNFSNHDFNFIPTRRDAEGILLLTLRIVEWHLSNTSDQI